MTLTHGLPQMGSFGKTKSTFHQSKKNRLGHLGDQTLAPHDSVYAKEM